MTESVKTDRTEDGRDGWFGPQRGGSCQAGRDAATVIGRGCGVGLIGGAILLGGQPASFLNLPSVLIVFGGTFAVTTMCFSLPEVTRTAGVLSKAVFRSDRDPSEAALNVLKVAEMARRQGVLSLQGVLDSLRHEPFLHKGISMSSTHAGRGSRDDHASRHAGTIQSHPKRRRLRKRPSTRPLGALRHPDRARQMLGAWRPLGIGTSMAVARLTTSMGRFSPIWSFHPRQPARTQLGENCGQQRFCMGVASIGRQENPRRLNAADRFCRPIKRVQYFD
jgi:chemotaxis protein MotA